jgi:hypothetical protein
MRNSYINFLKKCNVEIDRMKGEYESSMNKARNKNSAHNNFIRPIHDEYMNIQRKLDFYSRFFIEIEDVYENDSSKEYEDIFEAKIQMIPSKKLSGIIHDLILLYSLDKFISFALLEERKLQFNNEEDKPHKSEVNWIGTNETEFVQLIYALHEGKYIEGEGIIKIVEEISRLLNYPLGKHWQKNHSASIHNSNTDYNPKIFNSLNEKYKGYQRKQVEKRKEI